ASGPDAVEDRVLDGVGVLELVDQRDPVAAADRRGEARAVGAGEGVVELEEQVVEGEDAELALAPGELSPHVVDEPQRERELLSLAPGPALGVGGEEALEGVEEGVAGHLVGAALLAAEGELTRGELLEARI